MRDSVGCPRDTYTLYIDRVRYKFRINNGVLQRFPSTETTGTLTGTKPLSRNSTNSQVATRRVDHNQTR